LAATFPEIQFEGMLYKYIHTHFIKLLMWLIEEDDGRKEWADHSKRERFFTEFAEEQGFIPSDGCSWQNVTNTQIIAKKVSFPCICST